MSASFAQADVLSSLFPPPSVVRVAFIFEESNSVLSSIFRFPLEPCLCSSIAQNSGVARLLALSRTANPGIEASMRNEKLKPESPKDDVKSASPKLRPLGQLTL